MSTSCTPKDLGFCLEAVSSVRCKRAKACLSGSVLSVEVEVSSPVETSALTKTERHLQRGRIGSSVELQGAKVACHRSRAVGHVVRRWGDPDSERGDFGNTRSHVEPPSVVMLEIRSTATVETLSRSPSCAARAYRVLSGAPGGEGGLPPEPGGWTRGSMMGKLRFGVRRLW